MRKNKPKEIEWLNEDGSVSFDLTRKPMYRRVIPPPWENIDHKSIICYIIQNTSKNFTTKINYLEYGIRTGDCLEEVAKYVNTAYGVDILDYTSKRYNINFYKMYTNEFSKNHLNNISFNYAFIDADYSHSQVIIDFDNIFKNIEIGGFIFLHDTYPCIEENLLPGACSDCYKTPIYIKKHYKNIEILTIPINPGLTIIRKL